VALLALASIALVATTPAPPRVSSEAEGNLVLTDQQPQQRLWLTIVVSAETFSAAPPRGGLHVSLKALSIDVAKDGEASRLPVRTTYPDDLIREEDVWEDNSCTYGGREWCGIDEYRQFSVAACAGECRLSVPITLEWEKPEPGGQLSIDWRVSAALEWPFDTTPPGGAAILVEGLPR
jgi:hypothetical protein